MKYLYTKEQMQKLNEVIDKLENRCNAILYETQDVPESFVADMKLLFGFDEKNDCINNIFCSGGDPEDFFGCNLILIPKEIENNRFFIALSDYVNAFEMDWVLCLAHDESGKLLQYEIDKNNENVEGGSDVSISCDGVLMADEYNIFFHSEMVYGAKCGEPSEIAKDIKNGKHFIESLWYDKGEIFVRQKKKHGNQIIYRRELL